LHEFHVVLDKLGNVDIALLSLLMIRIRRGKTIDFEKGKACDNRPPAAG
jgi:hypothetical protein